MARKQYVSGTEGPRQPDSQHAARTQRVPTGGHRLQRTWDISCSSVHFNELVHIQLPVPWPSTGHLLGAKCLWDELTTSESSYDVAP